MRAGLNRVWWDLNSDLTKEARLRTSPRYAGYVKVGPEGMPAPGVGRWSVLVPPGEYTVKLKVGDQDFTQRLTVRKDPGSGGSEQGIQAQMALAEDLYHDINGVVEAINTLELVRGQLVTLKTFLASDSATADVRAQTDSLDQRLLAVEENLFQTRVTGRGQDLLRWPMKLAEQLLYLAGQVTSSDYAPTTQQREVHQLLHDQLDTHRGLLDQVVSRDLGAFNRLLQQRSLQGIMVRP